MLAITRSSQTTILRFRINPCNFRSESDAYINYVLGLHLSRSESDLAITATVGLGLIVVIRQTAKFGFGVNP